MTTTKTLDEQIQEIEDELVKTRFVPKSIDEQLKEIEDHLANNSPITLNEVYEESLKQTEEPYYKK